MSFYLCNYIYGSEEELNMEHELVPLLTALAYRLFRILASLVALGKKGPELETW